MTTTELIELLKSVEQGSSGRSRAISFYANGEYMAEPKVYISSTGDGTGGAQLVLE